MSMISNFIRVTQTELDNYLKDSSLLAKRVYSDLDFIDPNLIDIDKAWGGLFYLLSGESDENVQKVEGPLDWVIFGAEFIDEDQDMGYGPARYTTPEQVKQICQALNQLSATDLSSRYDADRMMALDIYPQVWDRGEDEMGYLYIYFEKLRDWYNEALKNNEGMISFVN